MTVTLHQLKTRQETVNDRTRSFVPKQENDNDPVKQTPDWAALIVDIAARQDAAAFKCLYNFFAPRVKSFALRGGFPADKAEVVAQETLIMVWRKASQYHPEKASVSTWIYTIARNKKIDLLRKDARPLPDLDDPIFETIENDTPESNTAAAQNARHINMAIASLPEDQRIAITMSFIEEKPHQEIASQLDIPLGTVKSRIRLGLARLKPLMTVKSIDNEQ